LSALSCNVEGLNCVDPRVDLLMADVPSGELRQQMLAVAEQQRWRRCSTRLATKYAAGFAAFGGDANVDV
jgi:hypothetical protein